MNETQQPTTYDEWQELIQEQEKSGLTKNL
jgi:hypothetical protein